jgi:SAM-dependent methyltransferase
MTRLTPPPVEYETDYFFGFYKAQYGKTYLEDFPNLLAVGQRRLKHIKTLLPPSPAGSVPRLLDIGCAYGPFLAVARDQGFAPLGIDPARDAVEYVRNELGIPASRGFFPAALSTLPPETNPGQSPFQVITLWYVIEHFENPGAILEEINRLLEPGGILAFSTPSYTGISGRLSLSTFLKKSPPDHWTVWSPRTARRVLSRRGFTVKKILVTGHHPERFPRGFQHPGIRWILPLLSRVFHLGDTFEVYAVKNREPGTSTPKRLNLLITSPHQPINKAGGKRW